MFTSVSRGVNGFSLQFCRVHTVNQVRLSNVSFKVTNRHVSTLKEYFATHFQYFCSMHHVFYKLFKKNMNKNKSKNIQVLSALLEGRSEEQLQQESSQTREKKELADTDRGLWFEQERQCLMISFSSKKRKLYPKYKWS